MPGFFQGKGPAVALAVIARAMAELFPAGNFPEISTAYVSISPGISFRHELFVPPGEPPMHFVRLFKSK